MDLELDGVAVNIASSTGNYLGEFAPIFLLVAGLVLALLIIERLLGFFDRDRDRDILD